MVHSEKGDEVPARMLLAAFLAIAPLWAQAQAQQPPEVPVYRYFKDWVIGCDNTRSCLAVGFPVEWDDMGFMQIAREAGPAARPIVTLAIYQETAPTDARLTVQMDGSPVKGVPAQVAITNQEEGFGYMLATLPPAQADELLAALRSGKKLSLATTGDNRAEVSLEGASAALLFMDDVQGRVGGATALVRRGDRPASAVPAAPPPPRITPVRTGGSGPDPELERIAREQLAVAEDDEDCYVPEGVSPSELIDVDPLGEGRVLVSILCNQGAYNFDREYFVVDRANPRTPRPVDFPLPDASPDQSGAVNNTLTNGEFDPATGLLAYFAKGRGIGDCGTSGTYAWTGSEFALVEYRTMHDCRGVPWPYWPVLWRATLP